MMRIYARIEEGVVRELFSTAGDMSEMFHPALVWADVTDVVPRPAQDWSAVQVGGDWAFALPAIG